MYYDVINVMLLSDDVTYEFVLSSVVSKHLLLTLSVLCLFVELTMVAERFKLLFGIRRVLCAVEKYG